MGAPIDWTPVAAPQPEAMRGRYVLLRPVEAGDAESLFEAGSDPDIWTYLPYGPYASVDEMRGRVSEMLGSLDPLYLAVCPDGAAAQGIASYLRIDTAHGSIEIGHIWFGTPLQRTAAATDAIYLLGRH